MAALAAIRSVSGMTSPTRTTPAAGRASLSASRSALRYGEREALTGLSFEVFRGELFALLGPTAQANAGGVLEGYRRCTGGQVSVLGADPWRRVAVAPRIGVMLQESRAGT